jgi:hypothetical protein
MEVHSREITRIVESLIDDSGRIFVHAKRLVFKNSILHLLGAT